MHEMALAEGILQIIEDTARQQGFSRVREVRLEIGALSGVEVEALSFCMDAVLANTLAEGATVTFERLPGVGWCMACGQSVPIQALYDACPECGSHQVQATGGSEMRVKDLLVD